MNARLFKVARVTSVIGCFLFVVAGSSARASNIVYTVQGRLKFEAVGNITRDIAFTVCVSNCLWSITGTASDVKGTIYKQVFDGDVVSSATRFPDEVRDKSTVGNDSTLGIDNIDMPDCLPVIGAGTIWLAYASFCKFTTGITGLLELTWFVNPEFRRDRYTTPASWKINLETPFLPTEVDYHRDINSIDRALGRNANPQTNIGGIGWTPPWASYKATTFTNIGLLRLPKTFTFEVYDRPNTASPKAKPSITYNYHGELTKVYQTVTREAFVHGFGTKTYVADGRFVSQSSPAAFVHYVATTNKTIPKTNEPQMITAAAQAKRSQVLGTFAPPSNNRMSTRSVLMLFGIGLTVFVLVILVLRQK